MLFLSQCSAFEILSKKIHSNHRQSEKIEIGHMLVISKTQLGHKHAAIRIHWSVYAIGSSCDSVGREFDDHQQFYIQRPQELTNEQFDDHQQFYIHTHTHIYTQIRKNLLFWRSYLTCKLWHHWFFIYLFFIIITEANRKGSIEENLLTTGKVLPTFNLPIFNSD